MFKDKTILVTGGTGSFGNAVVDRFLETDIAQIRIFSRDEKKQHDMRTKYNDSKLKFYIGDVRDKKSVDFAMKDVDYIFHAAALKQVPSCEFYPMEAVKTNVLGTENVLASAVEKGVSKVICLSTDKAVYPINAMGISKAMMEKVMVANSRSANGTIICATRYGNVMASRGSVIPIFVKQIKEGKDLTITDPNMTRFLMSLEEAVDLVLYAYKNAEAGDIFVQKAPACTVEVLVKALKELFDADNDIKIIGTRHGEKLFETLLTREEMSKAQDLPGYYRILPDNRDLNYENYFSKGETDLSAGSDYNSHNTKRLDINQVKDKLLEISFIRDQLENR